MFSTTILLTFIFVNIILESKIDVTLSKCSGSIICGKVNSSKHGNAKPLVGIDKCDVTER